MCRWPADARTSLSVVLSTGARGARCAARIGPERLAVLGAVAVAPLVWRLSGAWYSLILIPVAGFVGALVHTARRIGLIERNTAPTQAVRENVLALHHGVRCLPTPVAKRMFDLVAGSIGLLVSLPLWPIVAALIWFSEPGPILFIKYSVGRGGVTFQQIKFRSMRYRAEQETGPVRSSAGDARVLRVGRLLRRWHVDEVSELLNVLAGSMSLVGPRPLRTVLVQRDVEHTPAFAERHAVRPGIACVAQIQKYDMPLADRLRKDRVYIRRMCLGLDVRLLWRAAVTTARNSRTS